MIAHAEVRSATELTSVSPVCGEAVILVHGLAAHPLTLARLASIISRDGYRVVNWGYVSWRRRIHEHARSLTPTLDQLEADEGISRIHFVTHSMGGIITRAALFANRPGKLGRIVMLGPPNRGSHVARRMAGPLAWLCPALAELSDGDKSYVNQLPVGDHLDVGIIAAAADRVVPRSSTYLPAQRDWILLPGHHGALPWRAETGRQALHFLRHGHFIH